MSSYVAIGLKPEPVSSILEEDMVRRIASLATTYAAICSGLLAAAGPDAGLPKGQFRLGIQTVVEGSSVQVLRLTIEGHPSTSVSVFTESPKARIQPNVVLTDRRSTSTWPLLEEKKGHKAEVYIVLVDLQYFMQGGAPGVKETVRCVIHNGPGESQGEERLPGFKSFWHDLRVEARAGLYRYGQVVSVLQLSGFKVSLTADYDKNGKSEPGSKKP